MADDTRRIGRTLHDTGHGVHAYAIAGHELIWETAEQLIRLGALSAPPALSEPAATPAEVAALTFVRANP